jgi:peptidoglycan hydrolase-like protein with peptidoglycan-binding domain
MRFSGPWLKSAVASSVTVLVCSIAFPQANASSATPASKMVSPSTTSHPSTKVKSAKAKSTKTSASRKGKHSKKRGQQKIDGERTHQIQQALIQKGYLKGSPSDKWDASTESALRKFQADNGWQNKTVPDSRALIKLGLGPNHDHLLNPESAMTSIPDTPAAPAVPTSATEGKGPTAPPNQPQP